MKIYMSKADENIVIHLPLSLDDLKEIARIHGGDNGNLDCRLLLTGCHSAKDVSHSPTSPKPWSVFHGIDGTAGEYDDDGLKTETNIMKGIDNSSFLVLVDRKSCKCELTH